MVVVNRQFARVILADQDTAVTEPSDGVAFSSNDDANFKPDFGSDSHSEQHNETALESRRRAIADRMEKHNKSSKFFSIGSVDSFERRMDEAQK